MASLTALRARLGNTYPGWWVLAACCFIAVVPGAIFSYGFPVFFIPIRNDLMLSSTKTSLIFALARGEAGVGGPLVGWIVDRFDSRPIVMIGGLMAGVGLIILSGIDNYWVFMLVYVALVSVGNNSGFGQTLLAVTNRWFVRRKAVGMTMVITCYTIGGALLVPLLSRGVDYLGWRDVMLYAGIFVAVIVIPAALLIRRSPESMGVNLADFGEESESAPAEPVRPGGPQGTEINTGKDFTVGEALRTPAFWFILLGSAFRISVTGGILVHGIPIMVWKGTSEQTGANVIALLFLISIPTRFLIGMSGVRFSGQYLLAAGMAVGSASLLGLIFIGDIWIVYVFVVGLALLEGAATLNWVVVGTFFGRRNFATLTGIISIFYSTGMMLTPLFLGWMFDKTGSYTTSLLTLAALYGASAVLFGISRQPRLPFRPNREMARAGG